MSKRQRKKRIKSRNSEKFFPERMEFVPNKGTYAARKIVHINHNIEIELWFHKHYYERFYLGDEKGRRSGIDLASVESLVTRCLGHLFLFSTMVSGFVFVNKRPDERNIRVVLQEARAGSTLNVVVEVHPLSTNRFEVTVITAMSGIEFNIASGQYCVKIHHDYSLLNKFYNGKFHKICSFNLPEQ